MVLKYFLLIGLCKLVATHLCTFKNSWPIVFQYNTALDLLGNPKVSSILSAIILAMAIEDVAPGEGAFRQCKTRWLKIPV